jgi:signal peptidase I
LDRYKPWREYFENIMVAIFLAILVRAFVLTAYRVPTGSMAPTLKPGDFIFSFRIPYGVRMPFMKQKLAGRSPLRGEIVVFSYPEQPRTSYVKRVVGLPGDVIKIENGELSVNGVKFAQEEFGSELIQDRPSFGYEQVYLEKSPYGSHHIIRPKEGSSKNFGPLVIPPEEVFLLGDNRDASDDSRYWGSVPVERIEGRVVFIWLSLDWSKDPSNTLSESVGSKLPSVRWNRIFTSL